MSLANVLALSARMAALGDDSRLKIWPKYFRRLAETEPTVSLAEILSRRSRYGLWDIEEQLGEELALSLIDAQDFTLFYQRESAVLPKEARIWLQTWFAEAEIVSLDTEAADFLRGWLRTWPIPEEERLLPLVAPLSQKERSLLSAVEPPLPEIPVELNDSGEASLATPMGQIRIKCRFTHRAITFQIQDADGLPFPLRRAYLGVLPAFQDESVPETWAVDLSVLPGTMRSSLLARGLTAVHPLGGRLKIVALDRREWAYYAQFYRRKIVPALLLRERGVLASAASQESIPDSCRWISPDGAFAAWGIYRKKIDGSEIFELHFLRTGETPDKVADVPIQNEWDGTCVRFFGVEGTLLNGAVTFDLAAIQTEIAKREESGEPLNGLEIAQEESKTWEIWYPVEEE